MLRTIAAAFGILVALAALPAFAQKKYDPGASDSELKIGNIVPYSGPASVYSVYGRVFEAYFNRVNEQGGINGRRIKLISYDDGYLPPKTVEQARRLVESDEVLFLFGVVGTPTNAAIMKYMNTKKVRSCSPARGLRCWPILSTFPGRSVSSRTIRPKGASTRLGFLPTRQRRASACSIRMTISARICCGD